MRQLLVRDIYWNFIQLCLSAKPASFRWRILLFHRQVGFTLRSILALKRTILIFSSGKVEKMPIANFETDDNFHHPPYEASNDVLGLKGPLFDITLHSQAGEDAHEGLSVCLSAY